MSVEEKKVQTVVVKGKGETKVQAISDALSSIQKVILGKTDNVILRIEPTSVEVLSATEHRFTEKFLFFFWKRERVSFEVELKVATEMQVINTDKISFEKKEGKSGSSIQLPFTTKSL